jgi:hypothetical protein
MNQSRLRYLVFQVALVTVPLEFSDAAEIWWNGQSDTDFLNAANWDGNVVPSVGDVGIVARTGGFRPFIERGMSVQLDGLRIGDPGGDDGVHELVIRGGELAVNWIDVGFVSGHESRLTQLGGDLTVGDLGVGVGEPGQVNVSGSLYTTGDITLGELGIRLATVDGSSGEVRLGAGSLDARTLKTGLYRDSVGAATVVLESGDILLSGRADESSVQTDGVDFSAYRGNSEIQFEYFDQADFTRVEASPRLAIITGDSNQDGKFDQFDLVQILQRANYLTGLASTWGDGDWHGSPGGQIGDPPIGDGLFDQRDIVHALNAGFYLTRCDFCLAIHPVAQRPGLGIQEPITAVFVPEPSGLVLGLYALMVLASSRCSRKGMLKCCRNHLTLGRQEEEVAARSGFLDA